MDGRTDRKTRSIVVAALAVSLAGGAAAQAATSDSSTAARVPVLSDLPMPASLTRPPMHEYALAARAVSRPTVTAVPAPPDPAPSVPAPATAAEVQVAEAEPDRDPAPAIVVDDGGLPRIPGFQHNAPKAIVDLVEAMAPTYQLAPELVLAFMQAESSYNPNALSPKDARGLMQLMPGTAERFNVRKPYDPKQNIRGGMAYLRWLLAYFEGDLTLVAAGYNAGERRVDRYLGVPPYGETRAYVKRVVGALGIDAHPYDASITEPSARLEQIRASRARP